MTDNQSKKYSVNDIECIKGDEQVKSNPKMYWNTLLPTEKDAVNALAEQLNILGCKDIITIERKGWNYIGSKDDWIVSGLIGSRTVIELFNTGVGFPESGGLSMRAEYFIKILAEDLVLWRNNELTKIKGECAGIDVEVFENQYSNCVAIAFRGNTYAKKE